jgi:O-antigen/teichoic acid export membrane protein
VATTGGARRLFHTFISLVGAELITRGLVLVTGLILARALTPAEFGQFSYAFGVGLVAGLLIDLGLAALVIRDVSADPTRAPELLAAFLHAQALLAVGTFVLVALLTVTGVVGGPAADSSILIATAAVCVGGTARPFEATLTGRAQAHLVTISRSVRGVVLLGGTVLVAIVDPTVNLFLLAWLVGEVAGALAVAFLAITRSVRPLANDRRRQVGRLLKAALPFAIVTAAAVLYLRIDLLMLGHLDTATAVGNYGVAMRILDAAVILPAFFGNAFLATISATGPRTERGRMQATEALPWIVLFAAPITVTLIAAADPLIQVVTGGGYHAAAGILVRLAPFVVITASYGVLSSLQVSLNQLTLLMKLFAVGLVVKVGANLWAIPHYGANGAAVTAVLAELTVALMQWYFGRPWFDVRVAGAGVVRVLVAAAVALVAMVWLVDTIWWPLGVVLGLAVYVLAALATGAISRARVREVLDAIRGGAAPEPPAAAR